MEKPEGVIDEFYLKSNAYPTRIYFPYFLVEAVMFAHQPSGAVADLCRHLLLRFSRTQSRRSHFPLPSPFIQPSNLFMESRVIHR